MASPNRLFAKALHAVLRSSAVGFPLQPKRAIPASAAEKFRNV
jgi:hypothetical protein